MSDFSDALRALRATPAVTAVAVLQLALGSGANTAIFSIVDSLLLRSLPVEAPETLVLLSRDPGAPFSSWTNPQWEQVRERQHLVGGALAYASTRFNTTRG